MKRLLCVGSIAIVLLALSTVPPAAAADTRVKVLTINVCGTSSTCDNGDVDRVPKLIKDQAVLNDAHVIGAQEICVDQANRTLTSLGSGWKLYYGGVKTRSTLCGPHAGDHDVFGNAIFVQASSLSAGINVGPAPCGTAGLPDHAANDCMPNPSAAQARHIECVTAAGVRSRTVRLCNTHLDYLASGNPAQAAYVTRFMGIEKQKNPYVIFTGDVNYSYLTQQETDFAAVLPGEVRPTGSDLNSVDRVKFAGASQGAISRTSDPRTDHKIYATNIYLAG